MRVSVCLTCALSKFGKRNPYITKRLTNSAIDRTRRSQKSLDLYTRKCQFWLEETQTRTTTTNSYLKRRLVYSFNSISCCGNCSWICRFSTSSQRSKFVFDIHSVHFILHKTNTWPIWTYYLSSTNPLATWWQHFLWVFWFKWSIKYQKGGKE